VRRFGSHDVAIMSSSAPVLSDWIADRWLASLDLRAPVGMTWEGDGLPQPLSRFSLPASSRTLQGRRRPFEYRLRVAALPVFRGLVRE